MVRHGSLPGPQRRRLAQRVPANHLRSVVARVAWVGVVKVGRVEHADVIEPLAQQDGLKRGPGSSIFLKEPLHDRNQLGGCLGGWEKQGV